MFPAPDLGKHRTIFILADILCELISWGAILILCIAAVLGLDCLLDYRR